MYVHVFLLLLLSIYKIFFLLNCIIIPVEEYPDKIS